MGSFYSEKISDETHLALITTAHSGTLKNEIEPMEPTATTKDFYDRIDGSPRSFFGLLSLLLVAGFFTSVWWWSNDKFILLLSCGVVPTTFLALPRMVRDRFLAHRGAPALRISEQGVWSRQWPSLGWITWRDITSVECVSGGTTRQLVIHLSDKEFGCLSGHDQVSVMLVRLTGFLFFIDAGPNTISLIDSRNITSSWDDLMATLAPILAANGVPLLEKPEFT